MDIRKIKRLIDLLEGSEVHELEIREGDASVVIRRGRPAAPEPLPVLSADPGPVVPAALAAESAAPEMEGHPVRSPMVGTFYRASSPGARPFVDVGQQVRVGETLCIIEAMKMLNQIEADKAGVVTAVLVEDGQPVEFEQPLFLIR